MEKPLIVEKQREEKAPIKESTSITVFVIGVVITLIFAHFFMPILFDNLNDEESPPVTFSAPIKHDILDEKTAKEEPVDVFDNSETQLATGTVNPTYRPYYSQSQLANVYALIAPVKMQITTYYQMNGEFPKEDKDIDLELFDLTEHELINTSRITPNGVLEIGLADSFGTKRKMLIKPNTSKNGAFIKWHCLTNIDKQLLGSNTHFCRYSDAI